MSDNINLSSNVADITGIAVDTTRPPPNSPVADSSENIKVVTSDYDVRFLENRELIQEAVLQSEVPPCSSINSHPVGLQYHVSAEEARDLQIMCFNIKRASANSCLKYIFPIDKLSIPNPNILDVCYVSKRDLPFVHFHDWIVNLIEYPQRCNTREINCCNLYYVFGSYNYCLSYICCGQCFDTVKSKIFYHWNYVFVNEHHIHGYYHVHCMNCGLKINNRCIYQNVNTVKESWPIMYKS